MCPENTRHFKQDFGAASRSTIAPALLVRSLRSRNCLFYVRDRGGTAFTQSLFRGGVNDRDGSAIGSVSALAVDKKLAGIFHALHCHLIKALKIIARHLRGIGAVSAIRESLIAHRIQ